MKPLVGTARCNAGTPNFEGSLSTQPNSSCASQSTDHKQPCGSYHPPSFGTTQTQRCCSGDRRDKIGSPLRPRSTSSRVWLIGSQGCSLLAERAPATNACWCLQSQREEIQNCGAETAFHDPQPAMNLCSNHIVHTRWALRPARTHRKDPILRLLSLSSGTGVTIQVQHVPPPDSWLMPCCAGSSFGSRWKLSSSWRWGHS